MPVPSFDFTYRKIRDTYFRVMQVSHSDYILRDGLGDPVPLVISGNFTVLGTADLTASYVQIVSGSNAGYVLTSDVSGNAYWSPFSGSVSIDTSSFVLISQTSSMYVYSASYAATASILLNSISNDISSYGATGTGTAVYVKDAINPLTGLPYGTGGQAAAD